MPIQSGALSKQFCGRLFVQLDELIKSDTGLTDRLFRCRQILEEIFKELTSNTNISFTGLYARMQYAYESSILKSELHEQLQLLRLLTNKVIHKDDVIFSEQDFYNAVNVLHEALSTLGCGEVNISKDFLAFIKDNKPKKLHATKAAIESSVAHIYGIITSWKVSGTRESNRYLEIILQSSDGKEVTVTLWEKTEYSNCGRKWTLLDKALWKSCNISIYNLSIVHGNTNRFQSTPLTMIVLEPDFLMDVSAVADCFQPKDNYPELYVINKFFSEPITAPLAKGKCVNYIFDELITNPEKKLKDMFDEYLIINPLQLFSLGKETWDEIYNQIEHDHYNQLKEIAKMLSTKNCQLEPSFIAVKYGLHGRLDVITIPDAVSDKYSIIELKSGSAPSNDVWKGHQMQVVGYNLILKEVFGTTKIANSSIFYSRSSNTPLRHVVNHITLEQDFVMCRNRIVGILFNLAAKPEVFINWIKNNARLYPNEFISDKVKSLSSTLKCLSEREFKWFTEMLGFIFREIWAVKTGAFCDNEISGLGFSALWNSSLVEKKKQYRIIEGLWIESIEDEKIIFHRQETGYLSNLREGDIIVIYKQAVPITEQQLIRGTIKVLSENVIEVQTRSKIKPIGVFDNYTLWAIEPDLMESSLYGGLASLHTFIASNNVTRAKLMGFQTPEFNPDNDNKVLSWRNDIAESLKGMISAKDYYLVQGPPGTGKTSCLLLQYIQYIISETDKKLLIIAFTNRAVDEVCCHLDQENIEYIKFGSKKDKSDCSYAKSKNPCHNNVVYMNTESRFENSNIFVSTLHSFIAIAPDFLNKITIDEMIIDEASQILEHHVIGLMSRIKKTILIGDQNQLPPIILQHTDKEKSSILEKMISNAGKRLYTNCYSMLTNHYRMHKEITNLVADNYHNKLITDSKRQLIEAPWIKTNYEHLERIFKHRIVWIDTPPSQQSKADEFQAKWIKHFLDNISKTMPLDDVCAKIGIITPFRAQAYCIITALGAKYKNITVDTVERYQGSQRDCIIMSYPIRYHYEISLFQSINQLGTIDRKLNVAISRAREQLIILGSSKMLVQSEFFHKVFSIIKDTGSIVTPNISEFN